MGPSIGRPGSLRGKCTRKISDDSFGWIWWNVPWTIRKGRIRHTLKSRVLDTARVKSLTVCHHLHLRYPPIVILICCKVFSTFVWKRKKTILCKLLLWLLSNISLGSTTDARQVKRCKIGKPAPKGGHANVGLGDYSRLLGFWQKIIALMGRLPVCMNSVSVLVGSTWLMDVCPVKDYVNRILREAWCAELLPLLGLGTWRGLVVLLDTLRTMQLCFHN